MPFQDLITAIVAFLAGVIKSAFGIGAGIFLTPVLALVINPKEAVVLVAPMMLFTDITAIFQYWRRWSVKDVLLLTPACLIGAVAGALLLNWFTLQMAQRSIGAIGLLYVGTELLRKFVFPSSGTPGISKSTFIGIVGGVTSALANSGGVFISTYLTGRLSKQYFVGTLIAVFLSLNITKVSMFTGLGMLNKKLWLTALYLLPLMFIGSLAGKWLNTRIHEAQFARWVFVLIVGACIKLIFF